MKKVLIGTLCVLSLFACRYFAQAHIQNETTHPITIEVFYDKAKLSKELGMEEHTRFLLREQAECGGTFSDIDEATEMHRYTVAPEKTSSIGSPDAGNINFSNIKRLTIISQDSVSYDDGEAIHRAFEKVADERYQLVIRK
ncbi:MAG: hypothetical protein JWN76_586 [Chitinophagaceae bacterium]|nr:hypothetical protein [Chitinophagaceae bacterium]